MARREWVEQKVEGLEFIGHFNGADVPICESKDVIAALQAEHARAVRIVKRAKALQLHGLRDTDTNEFLEGYEAACADILAALSKGRA